MLKQTKGFKYKNFQYPEDVIKLLEINLNANDLKKLKKIQENFKSLNIERGYEYIIKDLFILKEKYDLSTKDLSHIYNLNIRTIQIWLKELGLNKRKNKSKKTNGFIEKIKFENQESDAEVNLNNFEFDFFNKIDSNLKIIGPDSLGDFLNYLESIKGKSKNTIEGYKIDLVLFFKFLKAYKKGIPKGIELTELDISDLDDEFVKEIKLRDLYAFLTYVEQVRSNSNYAKSRKVAALKSYFKFLQNKLKLIKENPANELETPKIEKRNPLYLDLEESILLLNSLDKKEKNYHRDYCILTLFLNCGMRLSELCNIQLSKLKEDTLSIVGKGNKERVVYLNEACIKSIRNYLKIRSLLEVDVEFSDFLFISSRKRSINKRTVEILVKKYIKKAGLPEGFTPHKLRHTAATLMYKHGNVDIRSIQSILGHENISTTQIYTHVDNDDLRNAMKKNPLSKI